MSIPNTTLWGGILPGGVAGELPQGGIDSQQVIDELLASLHADSRANLYPWTETDLIQWMDEALKRLARLAAVFVGRDVSTLTVSGTASYGLPTRHVATLHVSYGSTSLRPACMLELEARDPAFLTTAGTPDHWYEDRLGLATVGLAPVPNAAQFLGVIYAGWPDALDAGKQQILVAAPPPLKGWLAMAVLASAYGRESELEMEDVAQHCRGRMSLYESAMQSYFGKL